MGANDRIEERKTRNKPFMTAFDWLREQRHLTQAELAKEMGTNGSLISLYRNGTKLAGPDIKQRLCQAFGGTLYIPYLDGLSPYMLTANVPADELITETDQNNPDLEQIRKDKKKVPADEWRTPEKIISDLEALRSDLALELQDIRQIKFELTHEREVLQQITQQLTAELHAIRGSYDIQSAPIQMVADSDKKPK